MALLIPNSFNRTNRAHALFLTIVPTVLSLVAGVISFYELVPGDTDIAPLVAALVGCGVAFALSIRGADYLFLVALGCALITLAFTIQLKVPATPGPSIFLGVAYTVVMSLGFFLVLHAVMPRAEQLAE